MNKIALSFAVVVTTASAFSVASEENKTLATSAMQALFGDFDQDASRALLSDDYIQHNQHVATGPEALISILPMLKESNIKATSARLLAEGDLVVAHTLYENAQMLGAEQVVGFDVWRIENGKLAEHWDNLQPLVPAAETASGNGMLDGETEITDLNKTEENKALVLGFLGDVLVNGKGELITNYLAPEYIQHNPFVPNGLDGLMTALKGMAEAGIEVHYNKIHLTVAEGNFVFAASEGSFDGKATAFYDLFRVENGMIIEHWDVVSEIASESANDNGKF